MANEHSLGGSACSSTATLRRICLANDTRPKLTPRRDHNLTRRQEEYNTPASLADQSHWCSKHRAFVASSVRFHSCDGNLCAGHMACWLLQHLASVQAQGTNMTHLVLLFHLLLLGVGPGAPYPKTLNPGHADQGGVGQLVGRSLVQVLLKLLQDAACRTLHQTRLCCSRDGSASPWAILLRRLLMAAALVTAEPAWLGPKVVAADLTWCPHMAKPCIHSLLHVGCSTAAGGSCCRGLARPSSVAWVPALRSLAEPEPGSKRVMAV